MHTPTPWRYQEKSDAYTHIVRSGENRFVCQFPQGTGGTSEASARHTIACVNFFHGRDIPTENIPEGGIMEVIRVLAAAAGTIEGMEECAPDLKGNVQVVDAKKQIEDLLAKLGVEP